MTAIVDTREQFKQEIQAKLTKLNVPTVITKLDSYADYLLLSDNEETETVICVQRKQIGEYISQMDEVKYRIEELQENPTLLIEGTFQISVDGAIMVNRGKLLYEVGKVKSYFNSLNSLRMKGVTIVRTQSLEETIWWLYSTHSYIQKHHYPKPTRKYNQLEELVGALTGIRGIGEKKALQIVAAYTASTQKKEKPSDDGITPIDEEKFNSGDVVKSDNDFEEKEAWEDELNEEMKEIEKELEDLE